MSMTDEQIVKALKICGNNENCCKCPYYRSPSEIGIDCNDRLTLDALDLIKRQQEEIERLKQTPKCVFAYDGETLEYCVEGPCSAEKTIETIRAEAVRGFAEFLIGKAENNVIRIGDLCDYVIDFNEMTEKEGGKG